MFILICRDPADPTRKLFVPENEVLGQVVAVFRSIKIPEKLLDTLLAHMRTSHEAEQQFHIDTIAALRREYDRTRDKLHAARHPPQQEYYAGRVRQEGARTEAAADRDRPAD